MKMIIGIKVTKQDLIWRANNFYGALINKEKINY